MRNGKKWSSYNGETGWYTRSPNWRCCGCQFSNFGDRKKCQSCGLAKDASPPKQKAAEPSVRTPAVVAARAAVAAARPPPTTPPSPDGDDTDVAFKLQVEALTKEINALVVLTGPEFRPFEAQKRAQLAAIQAARREKNPAAALLQLERKAAEKQRQLDKKEEAIIELKGQMEKLALQLATFEQERDRHVMALLEISQERRRLQAALAEDGQQVASAEVAVHHLHTAAASYLQTMPADSPIRQAAAAFVGHLGVILQRQAQAQAPAAAPQTPQGAAPTQPASPDVAAVAAPGSGMDIDDTALTQECMQAAMDLEGLPPQQLLERAKRLAVLAASAGAHIKKMRLRP